MSINVGQMAPDFKLPNTEKEFFTLSQFNGKNNVLLLFIPFAFTGVCTTELCSVRDDIARYTSAGAEVLAISIDSPFALKRFKEEQNLPFQLLSDFNKEAITAFGNGYAEFSCGLKGVAKRSAFVIDKNGLIQYAEVLESAGDLPNFEAINKVLAGLN
ncbi:MAG: redoxin domain-containing protein [Bacteroidetes bacterium]|nr:redoxin domain-containing protein [Bacteroidota bacterium]PHX82830.1 MAG: peroxiredoxin [Flavobacteriales bacterium]